MKKNCFLLSAFCFLQIIGFAQNPYSNSSQNYDDIITNYKQLSLQQLLDTAHYFSNKNDCETALVYFNLILNSPVKEADVEQQKIIVRALNSSAKIYFYLCDYRTCYELLIKALMVCEKTEDISFQPTIYNNLSSIYNHFNRFDMAKEYIMKAISLCEDSVSLVVYFNNLGDNLINTENTDSALYYLNKSLQISKQNSNIYLDLVLNTIAEGYQKAKLYDSAFYYYRLSLDESKKSNKIILETHNLSKLGSLFFEINKLDSALHYIDLSNIIAKENNFLMILSENYLTLSKIEESKGHVAKAFEHFKTYANLKDSVFSVDKYGEINQLQRLYEVTKTNQQIEQLVVEQQIKERTIHYQKIIQLITLGVLLLVSVVLIYIFFQKRILNKAYKVLFEKNIELIDYQKNTIEKHKEKYRKSTLKHEVQYELLNKILIIMDNTSIICDPKFSVENLAELVQSNQLYVSQVINDVMKKNFRSFLNSYRIREAQRLFSEPDTAKYTIEAVSVQVGFKSRTAFRETFKEITGVSPNFYIKSIQDME